MSLLNKFFNWFADKCPNYGELTIKDLSGDKYLRRIYLTPQGINYKNKWKPSVFLHHFYRSDHDRDPHNHPWGLSISLILSGGYTEWRLVNGEMKKRRLWPGMINIIKLDSFHRVQLNNSQDGAWTLFISFNKVAGDDDNNWGFWSLDENRYIPKMEYLANKSLTNIDDTEGHKEHIFWQNNNILKTG